MKRLPAFSLVELLVVISIVAILAVVIVPVARNAQKKGDLARCSNNLRNLHVALSNHLQEHGSWPQVPEILTQQPELYGKWWVEQTEPYGGTLEAWHCPSLQKQLKDEDFEGPHSKPVIHYAVTHFDANPLTPHKWSTQPWLMEIADSHGIGNLLIFPDGSVQGSNDAMRRIMGDRPKLPSGK